jgi:hypothetical protein
VPPILSRPFGKPPATLPPLLLMLLLAVGQLGRVSTSSDATMDLTDVKHVRPVRLHRRARLEGKWRELHLH